MITLVAALSPEGVIGKQGRMPWHLASEQEHFRNLTMGKTVLMGRKTYESIGHPLAGRQNIVISRQHQYVGTTSFQSLAEAFRLIKEDIYVIGGAKIFEQAIPCANVLHLSLIKQSYPGDIYFPDFSPHHWQETTKEEHNEFTCITYQRI